MGDIISVTRSLFLPFRFAKPLEQLLPLSSSTINGYIPAKITVVGTVSSIEPASGSIIMDVDQAITGSTTRAHLECYGRLDRTQRPRGQLSNLPMPNTVATYTGELFGFDDDVILICVHSTVHMPRPRRLPLAALPFNYRRYRSQNVVS